MAIYGILSAMKFGMSRGALCALSAAAAALSAGAAPMIDDTPTRVQTTLDPGLPLLGALRPKPVSEISTSRWSVDAAGTDREHASWQAVREYLPPLGIRRVRTQAGWARCEKEPGKYDFRWLDAIVFDARRRGLEVWLEVSYGNPAYPGGGGRGLAGGMPSSEEALAAWDRWVAELARRYRGTVRDWCVWNEPDLMGANAIEKVIPFTLRTAETIKAEIPDARIAACALSWANPEYVGPFCKALKETGKAGLFAWLAYHHYSPNPDLGYDGEVAGARRLVAAYAPNLRLWMNESGAQSEWCESGAMSRRRWTELTQAKWDLRRYLADLGHGDDTGVFHACDLEYVNSGFHDGMVRYGLLKTAGQADDYRVLKVKTAYYAVQNAVSVFNDAVEPVVPAAKGGVALEGLATPAIYLFRDRETGTPMPVFWDASDVPSDSNATKSVTLSLPGRPLASPVWVDVLSGMVFAIPSERVSESGGRTVYAGLPCYDSPAFVCEERVLSYERVKWE